MKTVRLTALLAAVSVASGIAMAQPPDTTGTARMGERGGDRPGMMGGRQQEGGGPHAKLGIAARLETLTADQKAKVEALVQEGRAEMQAMREEMRTAMDQARSATDREARRKIMEPIREKHEAIQKRVDTALQGILTPEQLQEVNTKASKLGEGMRERMGDRRGPGADGETTGAKRSQDGAKRGKDGDRKKEGRKGKRGDRQGQRGDKAPAATDSATTGSAAANPFADQ